MEPQTEKKSLLPVWVGRAAIMGTTGTMFLVASVSAIDFTSVTELIDEVVLIFPELVDTVVAILPVVIVVAIAGLILGIMSSVVAKIRL
jgi:hypothetical protein